jgi:large-conductance mechanosensitive channel
MPKPTWGEIYFVGGMMALVLVISAVSIYLFVKTYRKEMREKEERSSKRQNDAELSDEESGDR